MSACTFGMHSAGNWKLQFGKRMWGVSFSESTEQIGLDIPHGLLTWAVILQAMEQSATAAPSPGSQSFAGFLAALAAPTENGEPVWNDDDLAEDVATLTYERGSETHTRNSAPEFNDRSMTESAAREHLRILEALPDDLRSAAQTATLESPAPSSVHAEAKLPHNDSTADDRNLKSTSITIRLSKTECEQLRKRAAEAGLTVSAYLRSCTFEAESLRAMVKDTLAQLRSDPSKEDQDSTPPAKGSWLGRWRQRLPQARASQRVAQA
jgi:hypothetical protein